MGEVREISLLRRLADAWIGGGWHTMLAAAGLAADAGVRFGYRWRETATFAAFVGGSALLLYGGRYALRMAAGGDGDRERALRNVPASAIFSCVAGAVAAAFGVLALPAPFILWEALCGVTALAYCYPLTGKPWREYGPLKPFMLALCWTAATCGPPDVSGYTALFLPRLVWLTGLALAFDTKDIAKDRAAGVLTPAVRWSETRLWCAIAGFLTAGLFAKLAVVPPESRALTAAAWILASLMLLKIRGNPSTRAWVVWGDGMMIVYSLPPLLAFVRIPE